MPCVRLHVSVFVSYGRCKIIRIDLFMLLFNFYNNRYSSPKTNNCVQAFFQTNICTCMPFFYCMFVSPFSICLYMYCSSSSIYFVSFRKIGQSSYSFLCPKNEVINYYNIYDRDPAHLSPTHI